MHFLLIVTDNIACDTKVQNFYYIASDINIFLYKNSFRGYTISHPGCEPGQQAFWILVQEAEWSAGLLQAVQHHIYLIEQLTNSQRCPENKDAQNDFYYNGYGEAYPFP